VIAKLKQQTLKPIAAYHVSGEYAAIEALAEKSLVNVKRTSGSMDCINKSRCGYNYFLCC
jgi:delta-aminolevulinic acid dehydratase/porphobilinogen synthase